MRSLELCGGFSSHLPAVRLKPLAADLEVRLRLGLEVPKGPEACGQTHGLLLVLGHRPPFFPHFSSTEICLHALQALCPRLTLRAVGVLAQGQESQFHRRDPSLPEARARGPELGWGEPGEPYPVQSLCTTFKAVSLTAHHHPLLAEG